MELGTAELEGSWAAGQPPRHAGSFFINGAGAGNVAAPIKIFYNHEVYFAHTRRRRAGTIAHDSAAFVLKYTKPKELEKHKAQANACVHA